MIAPSDKLVLLLWELVKGVSLATAASVTIHQASDLLIATDTTVITFFNID